MIGEFVAPSQPVLKLVVGKLRTIFNCWICWVWSEHLFSWGHRSLGFLAGQEGMPISMERYPTSFYCERNTASIGQRRLLGMLLSSHDHFEAILSKRKNQKEVDLNRLKRHES